MELKASDLRIGNLVKWKSTGKIEHVVDINSSSKYQTINNVQITDAEPIPISEDWLIKGGFVENKYEYSIPISDCGLVTLTLIPHDEQHSKFSVCVSQSDEHDVESVFLEEISFWHELQNLYKSISGKELNFTP